MRTLSGPSDLIEKERIRLQINAQIEEFLSRGGAIKVVTGSARSAIEDAGCDWDDDEEEEPASLSD